MRSRQWASITPTMIARADGDERLFVEVHV